MPIIELFLATADEYGIKANAVKNVTNEDVL